MYKSCNIPAFSSLDPSTARAGEGRGVPGVWRVWGQQPRGVNGGGEPRQTGWVAAEGERRLRDRNGSHLTTGMATGRTAAP